MKLVKIMWILPQLFPSMKRWSMPFVYLFYRVPGINIATDIICGFPTETKEVTSCSQYSICVEKSSSFPRILLKRLNWLNVTSFQVCSSINFTLVQVPLQLECIGYPHMRSRSGLEHCHIYFIPMNHMDTRWERDKWYSPLNYLTTSSTMLLTTSSMNR